MKFVLVIAGQNCSQIYNTFRSSICRLSSDLSLENIPNRFFTGWRHPPVPVETVPNVVADGNEKNPLIIQTADVFCLFSHSYLSWKSPNSPLFVLFADEWRYSAEMNFSAEIKFFIGGYTVMLRQDNVVAAWKWKDAVSAVIVSVR